MATISTVKRGQFIYLTGCDGAGKTTQAQLLLKHYQAQGLKTRHVWLRFPFFFSVPLLAYARLRRLSWHEVVEGVHHGYWDFRRSWLMVRVFPWALLLDAALAALGKIYLPLWRGETVVCERFVLDMLVDLSLAYGEPRFYTRWPGRLFLKLIPRRARLVMLEAGLRTLHTRRADLRHDSKLADRLQAYRLLAGGLHLQTISTVLPVADANRLLQLALREPLDLASAH